MPECFKVVFTMQGATQVLSLPLDGTTKARQNSSDSSFATHLSTPKG